jgi:Caspase domain
MARQACISIGIDRYQFFQPLSFASADAQSIQTFFIGDAGWSDNLCLLMTDSSGSIGGRSTLPNRQNMQEMLNLWCWEVLQPGDLLCFFFSGYGVSAGNNEYLLPIDGDPAAIDRTGINLTQLYRQFSAPGLQVVVFLDVNRSQSGGTSAGFGKIASQLAQEYEIPTFLSCQPQEFSHEAQGLRHGIFTASLIEALRFHPDLSLDHLKNYLESRVPELSEHHWRPLQHPVALLPNNATMFKSAFVEGERSGALVPRSGLVQRQVSDRPASSPTSKSAIVPYQPGRNGQSRGAKQSRPSQKLKLKPILIGLVGAALTGGVIIGVVSQQKAPVVQTPVPPSAAATVSVPSVTPTDRFVVAQQAVKAGDANSYVEAIALGRQIPKDHPKYKEAQESIVEWSKDIYLLAKQQAALEDWGQAIKIAKLVPDGSAMHPAAKNAIRLWERQLAKKSKKP